MKKKVLFVINSLGCGGAEKSLVSMLSAFDYEKYEVYLQMFRLEGMFLKLLPEEVHVLPELEYMNFCGKSFVQQLKNPKLLFVKLKTSLGLRFNSKTKKMHDAQCYWKYANTAFDQMTDNFDMAIAWGQGNPTHFVCEKVNAKRKIAFINVNYEAAGHNKNFDAPFYEKYDHIVAVSEELRKLTISVYPQMSDKIVTMYDINNANLIRKMAEIENPFRNLKQKIKIVTVGRLVEQKGYDLLTVACKYLKNEGIKFVWYIVGEGPERKNIEKDIQEIGLEDCLFLQGEKDNPYSYMKNADVYVQTSRFEGYCLTLAEARILNVPIVSTNFDVVYNQLENEKNGLVVEMTGEFIAEGVLRIIRDEALREKIVHNLEKEKKGNVEEIDKLYQLFEQ